MTKAQDGLTIEGLTRRFGGREVVSDVSFRVAPGQVTCLLGPSGCGKSTTLRLIAGVDAPDKGEVRVDGRLMCSPDMSLPPEERGIGLMFQDFALFPHLTVIDNICFGLKGRKESRRATASDLLERVHLGSPLRKPIPTNCRAANNSAWPWRARWRQNRVSF